MPGTTMCHMPGKFFLEHFLKIYYNMSDNSRLLPDLSDSIEQTKQYRHPPV